MKEFLAVVAAIFAVVFAWKTYDARFGSKAPGKSQPTGVGISARLEPFYTALFSDLSTQHTEDLVPALQGIHERLADMRPRVEPKKQPSYDAGLQLVSAMTEVARIRTRDHQAFLRSAAQASSALNHTSTRNFDIFNQPIIKRWEAERRARKPALEQLRDKLKAAERTVNQQLGPRSNLESYDGDDPAPVFLKVDRGSGSNSLGRGAYDQRSFSTQ